MMSKNNPSVIMEIGSVSNTKIGFTNKWRMPKTIATQIEVAKSWTTTPGKNFEINKTNMLVTSIL